MEKTLLIVKPDAIQRRLIGEIVARFEKKGFQILAMKMARLPEEAIRRHYGAHEGKPFYEPLVRYMSGNPVILIVVQAKDAIAIARGMMGKTFGCDAAPGTIRGEIEVSLPLLKAAHCDAIIEDADAQRRHTIPPRLRRLAFQRARYRCEAEGCGNASFLSIHHRRPVAGAGANELANLSVLCWHCHENLHRSEQAARDAMRKTPV